MSPSAHEYLRHILDELNYLSPREVLGYLFIEDSS